MRTIGADPEMFLRDTGSGGVTPACGLFGGTKGSPIPIEGITAEGFGLQEDNVMLEFNVPPATNEVMFDQHIGEALDRIDNLIRVRYPNLCMDFHPARRFTPDQLDSPQAQEFGCAPEFNAYRQGAPVPPVMRRFLRDDDGAEWRFAGGHVHIGYEPADVPQYVVAQLCDLLIGLPSVAMDKQDRRRTLYGQAGRFRPTDYGIEYRTLSNFWVFDSNLRQEIGWRALEVARLAEDADRAHQVFSEIPWNDVRSAINNEIEELAADLIAYATSDLGLEA